MMSKGNLEKAVRNKELLRALDEWERLTDVKSQLLEAIRTMEEFGVDEGAIDAVKSKFSEYVRIKSEYENFIENAFGVTWHYWKLLLKLRNASDEEIDNTSRVA